MTLDDILNEEISLFKPYKTRFGKYVPIPYKSSTIKEVLTSLRIYKDVTKRVKYIHDNYSSEKYKEVKGSSLISATFSGFSFFLYILLLHGEQCKTHMAAT